jgi:hypothetical protein
VKTQAPTTVEFGKLVLAIYDEAAEYSDDPQEVSRLVMQTVQEILWHRPRPKISRPPRIYN